LGLEPDRLARVSTEIDALVASWARGERLTEDFWTYDDPNTGAAVLYRVHQLERNLETLPLVLDSSALAATRHAAFGGPSRLRVAALILKLPHCAFGVPWHRDRMDVPVGTVYNFSAFFDDSDLENGCLEFVAGTHLDSSPAAHETEQPLGAVALSARRGEICIHDVRVLHGSGASRCARMRRSIVTEFEAL